MKRIITILLVFVISTPVFAQEPVSPGTLLNNALNAVAAQVVDSLDVPGESAAVFPSVEGDFPQEYARSIILQWQQVCQQQGWTVFIVPQDSLYQMQFTVSEYQFDLAKHGKIRLFKSRDYQGIFELLGTITVISPTQELIGTYPVSYTKTFQVNDNQYLWQDEDMKEKYPIRWQGTGENPGLATILLSITSGVIIYLFYSMRG